MSAAAVISMRVKKIFACLRERNALSPETAIPPAEIPYSNKWYFRKLIRREVVKRYNGRCYLDEAAAQQYWKNRRLRAILFLGLAVLIFLAYVALLASL